MRGIISHYVSNASQNSNLGQFLFVFILGEQEILSQKCGLIENCMCTRLMLYLALAVFCKRTPH